jgi:iron complex outermembrane receptor protein
MRIRHSIIILLLHFYAGIASAQGDSIAFTNIVDSFALITAKPFSEGISKQFFRKELLQNYQGQSLSEVLSREAGVFVKQYGAGLLSTITHRGGSASQTAVLWEGVNILNPMLGQSDLSLLPVLFSDAAQWQSGGNSAQNGNNAIGGSLQISSNSDFNSGWKSMALIQMGSFGELKQQFRLQYGNERYAGSIRTFYQKADNNYLFRDVNAFGNPKPMKRLSHAEQEAWGLMQENTLRLGKGHQLSWKHWYQNAYRQIPPNLLQTVGDNEEQWDESFRNVISWLKAGTKSIWKTDAALSIERLDYKNNVLLSQSRTVTSLIKASQIYSFNEENILNWGLEQQYQRAFSDNYNKSQQQLALFATYKLASKITSYKWVLNLSAREQLIDRKFLLPAIGINFTYFKINEKLRHFRIQSSISHNYRYPTLNDRFWPLGGNPNLLPEYSLSADVKFRFSNLEISRFHYRFEIGAYSNFVRNWIQWTPTNGALWEPKNLANVWAYGPELSANLAHYIKSHYFSLKGQYQMNRAIRVLETDPGLQNKQLIYTPEHCISGAFDWDLKKIFAVRYRHNYYSLRYLDTENTAALKAYQTGCLQLEYTIQTTFMKIKLRSTVDNIWGAEYQAVANRQMPGRSLSFSLLFLN